MGPEILLLAGTAVSAFGQMQASSAANAASKAEAEQMRVRAMQERAIASHKTEEMERDAQKLQSTQMATAMTSGGDLNDFAEIMGSTKARSDYLKRFEMAKGEQAKQDLDYQATVKEQEAAAKKKAAQWQIAGTVLSGVSSWGRQGGWGRMQTELGVA